MLLRAGAITFSASGDATLRAWESEVTIFYLSCLFACLLRWLSALHFVHFVIAFVFACNRSFVAVQTGQSIGVLKGHSGWVSSLCLVGGEIWSGASDGRLLVWDADVTFPSLWPLCRSFRLINGS